MDRFFRLGLNITLLVFYTSGITAYSENESEHGVSMFFLIRTNVILGSNLAITLRAT